MGHALQSAWLRRGALACLLWPLSLLFRALVALRRRLYRSGRLKSARLPVPVVVVGNVVAGGAGKTPVLLALLEHLAARGLRAGVISRGYGRRSRACLEVGPASQPEQVGDEPLLIQRAAGVPVVVARRRIDAGKALLAAHPEVQVIVCDDGLQHLALQRDIELCVFDARGLGNGWLQPAGPLREPWPRQVDFMLAPAEFAAAHQGFSVERELAPVVCNGRAERTDLSALRGKPLLAVAGIANPPAFFGMLRAQGLDLECTFALPDHYDFSGAPLPLDPAMIIVCTEKDAVKLWRSRPDAWAVPLVVRIDPAFWPPFDRLLDAKLSSVHGSETA
ncbi:tetraacyldisaccharide 4'-kinase [Caenimonas terrae]|uniref:Tetraacyldisaccharide 4'-kinase n=1 Tax=Caenimonas terrae TaxID=696074 RepID=A0ABW0NJM0_9BURK